MTQWLLEASPSHESVDSQPIGPRKMNNKNQSLRAHNHKFGMIAMTEGNENQVGSKNYI